MLNSKTVFILGAGASFEVGFPLGSQLKSTIAKKLQINRDKFRRIISVGDSEILSLLKSTYREDCYLSTCQQISAGILLSDSIDDYIDIHQHDEKIAICGKVAITSSILEAERLSKIFYNKYKESCFDFTSVNDSWYPRFYSLVAKGIAKSDIHNIFNNVSIISFNYDRSLEHYLTEALKVNYCIPREDALRIVNTLPIFRPYGSIGKTIDYGSEDLPPVDEILKNIKTYTEQVADAEGLKKAHAALEEAKTLVFMGMHFHPNNLKILRGAKPLSPDAIYATRLSFSDHDLGVVKKLIRETLVPPPMDETKFRFSERLNDRFYFASTCSDIFSQYHMSLRDM